VGEEEEEEEATRTDDFPEGFLSYCPSCTTEHKVGVWRKEGRKYCRETFPEKGSN